MNEQLTDANEVNTVAVVTGASRGIGKSIALQLAQHFIVVGTATTPAGAEGISEYLRAAGNKGKGLCVDVSSDDSLNTFLSQLKEQFDAPLVLVNNAGITRDNILLRMKDAEWNEVINTNLSAVFKLSKALLKGMTKARWGRIINVSSVVGSMGNMGQANYAATKAGVIGFAKSLAREVGSRNITVNTVAPGFIDTDMTRALSEEQREAMLSQIPLARLGSGEEIAATVAFLASDGAAYITGETIHINGGMYMT
ncbi:MAG: 3-oxoacyl-ACP reductase FabG [Pseudomonadales bacterium]